MTLLLTMKIEVICTYMLAEDLSAYGMGERSKTELEMLVDSCVERRIKRYK